MTHFLINPNSIQKQKLNTQSEKMYESVFFPQHALFSVSLQSHAILQLGLI